MSVLTIRPVPLTPEAFAPFGEVIAAGLGTHITINDGTSERYSDLAQIDVDAEGGRANVSYVRAQPRDLPLAVRMVERHPLGSQAFMPLSETPFLLLVAPPGETVRPGDLRAFKSAPGQGVNYRRGTWHHPLIAIETVSPFLVLDRIGNDENCDEVWFEDAEILLDA
jgi:ureidoglycolate lyase